jgi:hypothetical protein
MPAQRRSLSIGQTLSKVFASHHMAIELAIDAISQRAGALILRSALISGSRQSRLASGFPSLARDSRLATRRASFSSQCSLLGGCQFSFGFRFHGFPFFLKSPVDQVWWTDSGCPCPLSSERLNPRKVELCLTNSGKLAQIPPLFGEVPQPRARLAIAAP